AHALSMRAAILVVLFGCRWAEVTHNKAIDAAAPEAEAAPKGGVWTACTSPGGISACGGPSQCMCPDNPDYCPNTTGDTGLCDFNFGPEGLPPCAPGSEDGLICVGFGATDQPQHEAYFDTGVLLSQNGD